MEQQQSAETIEKLRRHVQELLDQYVSQTRLGFALMVSEQYVQQENWLYLIVVPSDEGVRAYDYAQALTDVETKLRRDEGVENVLLVPAMAA